MPKPTILVTGATGKTGGATVAQLLERDYPVRALAHRDDPRAERLLAAGADVRVGSLEDPIAVREAMRDVQRAYFCPSLEPVRQRAGPEPVAYGSIPHRRSSPRPL
jgi:NAD(P)H dehydrogenase (quinone)